MKKTKTKSFKLSASSESFNAIRVHDAFYSHANLLRDHFETVFENPYQAKSSRFCWDYWTIPGQYRLLRTEPQHFFGEKLFQPFLKHLIHWSRQNLGCQMISQPWLSAYVDGCFQNMHSDVPHGPLSFVFSLSPRKIRFQGGSTFVAKPKLLRYFQEIDPERSHEKKDFIQTVVPTFNRLVVFDPRYPHGVEPVSGVESILDSRLVIHGWFTDPRPMLEGNLLVKQAVPILDQLAEQLMNRLKEKRYSGLISLRLEVLADGRIDRVTVLTAHLFTPEGTMFKAQMLKSLFPSDLRFPRTRGPTRITLPIQLL